MTTPSPFDSDLIPILPPFDKVQSGAGLDGTDIRQTEVHIAASGKPEHRPIGERINEQDLAAFAGRAFPVTAYQHPYYAVDFVSGGSSEDPDQPVARPEADIREAQVISSELVKDGKKTGYHTVMIDVDHPVRVVASSTPGHYHVYIDRPVPHNDYFALLKALSEAGVIEEGYYEASLARGGSHLRLPWVRKGQEPTTSREFFETEAEARKFDEGRGGVGWAIPARMADAIQQSKDGDVDSVEGFSLDDFVEISRPTEENPTGLPTEERVNEAEETARLDKARAQFHSVRLGEDAEIKFDPAEYAVTYVDGVGVLRRRRS